MTKIRQILILTLLLSATTLFSDEIPLYMFLPNITGDLVHIYPDIAYERNPSLILQFKKKMIIPSFKIKINNFEDERHWKVNEIYHEKADFNISSDLSTAIFVPILGGKSVFGGRFSGYHYFSEFLETLEYIDLPENNYILEKNYYNYSLSGDLFLSVKLWNLDFGIIGGIYYKNNPAKDRFPMITNKSKSLEAYTDMEKISETVEFNPSVTIGTSIPVFKGRFGLSGNITYSNTEHNTFMSADKDDDGFNESIVTKKEYMLDDEWGYGHSFFEEQNNFTSLKITLSPDYIFPIAENTDLFISADWQIINLSIKTEYEHTESTEKNIKITETKKAYGIDSFNITCGISKELHPTFKLRIGGGYEREVTSNKIVTLLDEDGTSSFNDNNSNHYGEINISYDPDNEYIYTKSNFGKYSDLRNTSDFEVLHIMKILAGGKWEPVERVSFFSSVTATFDILEKYWYVYETHDDTIWSERKLENNLDIDLNTIIGTAIRLTDSFTISFNSSFGSIRDNFYSTENFLPGKGDSGETDSVITYDNNFNIQFSFLIEL